MAEDNVVQITLAAARVNAGMSQEDVSREMHVSKNTIVNWEKGRNEPSWSDMRRLCALYKMPLECIILPTKSN